MKITLKIAAFCALAALSRTLPSHAQPPGGARRFPKPVPPAGTTIYRDLAYVPGGHARQKLDLYLPPTPPKNGKNYPLVVYVHGGAFKFGDKNSAFLPVRLLAKGYALASLDYRLSGDARFPAPIQDCKSAVRFLRANASKYKLDPRRFAAFGESAGGNLAALLGTTGKTYALDVGPHIHFASGVQGVVDHYGPTDFLQLDAQRIEGGELHDPADSPESLLIGGAIQDNPEQVRRANPISYISPATPPFFIAHGTKDKTVAFGQSQLLADALQKAGRNVRFLPVEGAGHGFTGATGAQKAEVDAQTDAFLARIFGE